jgi:hypothetical protein
MSCDLGIQRITKEAVEGKPWFKFTEGDKYVYILESPGGRITQSNYIGAAKTLANYINKGINEGNKNIGDIAYPVFLNGNGVVELNPSKKQLDLLNAQREEEIAELQKEVDEENLAKEFDKLNKDANVVVEDGEVNPMLQLKKENELPASPQLIKLMKDANAKVHMKLNDTQRQL